MPGQHKAEKHAAGIAHKDPCALTTSESPVKQQKGKQHYADDAQKLGCVDIALAHGNDDHAAHCHQ